ncbi:MAG: VpsF family polysaccharide biosynthesis protein [Hyphomicrobiaceae bacterium]
MTAHAIQNGTVGAQSRVLAAGRFMIVALLLCISTDVLLTFGWQYDATGGTPLDKFHPSTWIALALLPVMTTVRGNPLTGMIRLADRHLDLLPFLLGIIFMIVYATRVIGAPFTIFIETFFVPMVLFLIFQPLEEREARRLAWLIHLIMAVNAVLALTEFATGWRLTPFMVNGEIMSNEWRATALLGHPLSNAAIVGCYLVMLLMGGRRDLPRLLALLLFSLSFASMIAFGGRASMALVLAAMALLVVVRAIDVLNGAPLRMSMLRAILVAVPVYAAAIFALQEYGFFDRFLERIADDAGSAETRVVMFELFQHVNFSDIFFKPDAQHIGTWVNIHGLDYGIENFVLAFIFSFGILATIVFLPTLVMFCYTVTKALRPGAGWVFVYFFAVAMTSVSLSAKTPLLSVVIVLLMVLMRPVREQRSGHESCA